ncbi:Nif11-like leader peptide family natural product precursor [Azospirillum sp.]|uniref:Nif11-like leader peptide family natural product precursor n=1 Tax=Azospirillum sp. TaxID=34012 RepID=UPI003D751710
MGQTDYLRFLVAAESDPDLRADLRRSSAALRTLEDLVDFGERHGFRFDTADVPVTSPAEPR